MGAGAVFVFTIGFPFTAIMRRPFGAGGRSTACSPVGAGGLFVSCACIFGAPASSAGPMSAAATNFLNLFPKPLLLGCMQ